MIFADRDLRSDDVMTPWPLTVGTATEELVAYQAAAAEPEMWDLPTRCVPWTVRDVTRHLAATFQRFADMLVRSRAGDLSPPFRQGQLDAENLRAVAEFQGPPESRLRSEFERFVEMIDDGRELMAHQRGNISVALQLLFGLNDLVVHHDDIAVAAGSSYRPNVAVIELLVPVREHVTGTPVVGDPWPVLVDR